MKRELNVKLLSLMLWLVFARAATAVELGEAAPKLSIAQWVKGQPLDFEDGKGKNLYVIVFWAIGCDPCRMNIPHLTEFQKKFKEQGVVLVGISDDPPEAVMSFVEKMGGQLDFLVAADDQHKTFDAYTKFFSDRSLPQAFVVDKNGKPAWHGHPLAGLDKAIGELLSASFDIDSAKKVANAERLQQEYFAIVRTAAVNPRAAQLAKEIMADGAANPWLLNNFAWVILTDQRIRHRDIDLALRASQGAHSAANGTNSFFADTYARALNLNGKKAEAIKVQKQAIATCKDQQERANLEETLKSYETKLKDESP